MKWALFLTLFLMTGTMARAAQGPLVKYCLNPEVRLKDLSRLRAGHFINPDQFLPRQKSLLEQFLNQKLNDGQFSLWSQINNDQATTFLAVTNALAQIHLKVNSDTPLTALDLVDQVNEIRGVRLIAIINPKTLNRWVKAGAYYHLFPMDGSVETGKVNFAHHSQKGGGLHCGFDIQGFTRYDRTPYIHWNYRESDGSSDIHLDGMQPWIGGVIPNINHLTYENSDVRYWLQKYLRKYGSPGFEVTTATP